MAQDHAPHPLITPHTVRLPALATGIEGLRVLHLTDLHVRRFKNKYRDLVRVVGRTEHDLLLLTGDYMHRPGCESAARDVLAALLAAARPRLGAFGVLGNHDHPELLDQLRSLPVTWLVDRAVDVPGVPVRVMGMNCDFHHREGDPAPLLRAEAARTDREDRPLRLFLSHMPIHLKPVAEQGIDLMFSGHTHGGQCRLPGRVILYNACRWPRRFSAGHMQLADTHLILSRGLGESNLDNLRLLCPRQMPLITLTRGERAPIPRDRLVGHALW